jgi:hypothetical protein
MRCDFSAQVTRETNSHAGVGDASRQTLACWMRPLDVINRVWSRIDQITTGTQFGKRLCANRGRTKLAEMGGRSVKMSPEPTRDRTRKHNIPLAGASRLFDLVFACKTCVTRIQVLRSLEVLAWPSIRRREPFIHPLACSHKPSADPRAGLCSNQHNTSSSSSSSSLHLAL